jgi:hypothetical protein
MRRNIDKSQDKKDNQVLLWTYTLPKRSCLDTEDKVSLLGGVIIVAVAALSKSVLLKRRRK